jgi:hypothetical protein
MLQIGIAQINKTPSLITNLDEIAKIVNKKTKSTKGFFIPAKYEKLIKDAIEQIEYQKFIAKNRGLIDSEKFDDTLLDGLDDEY